MRKEITFFILALMSLVGSAQSPNAQEQSKRNVEGNLNVQLQKSSYVLLEPLVAKFTYTPFSTTADPPSRVLQNSTVRITSSTGIKEFQGLTQFITSSPTERLPNTGTFSGLLNPRTSRSKDFETEEIIDRVKDFFPEPGNYQLQFSLHGAKSNLLDITIEEPTGINSEAHNFLKKYEGDISFYWVWTEKNGLRLLETFANNYADSVYGDYAIQYLGNIYLAKGEPIKAKAEFEKLKSRTNKHIADEAIKVLADIEQKKASPKKSDPTH